MPLKGNSHDYYKIFFFILMLTFLANPNAFSQNKSLAAEEDKLAKLYSKMVSFIHGSSDSIEIYSNKFEKEFTRFIVNNPGSLNYNFKKIIDSNFCQIETSQDRDFRIYSWDTWKGGTMHFFKGIYQWKSNGKVFTKVPVLETEDAGSYCSAIYTVQINNTPYYLAVKNGIYSTKDAMQSVNAYRINSKLVEPVKLFKTKKEILNTIVVFFDFFSVVDRPERPLQLITYDDKLNILYIPLVDDKDQVTKKNLLYQLKGRYFEYIGVETGKRGTK